MLIASPAAAIGAHCVAKHNAGCRRRQEPRSPVQPLNRACCDEGFTVRRR